MFILAGTGHSAFAGELSLDQLIENMEKAVNPRGVGEKLKTRVMKGKVTLPAQQVVGKLESIEKFPDKTKTIMEIPGAMRSVQAYDGKIAWASMNAMGVREIKGKELEFFKFDAMLKNPKLKLKEMFSKIDLEKDAGKVNGRDCHKLTCYPPEKYGLKPIAMFVDKKSFYVLKIEMTVVAQMGEIPVVAEMSDFKEIKGLVIPAKTVTTHLGMTMIMEVTSVKYNEKINDSIFEMPEK
jgi:hypothetical protein